MPGRRITDHQIRLYMKSKQERKSQRAAAASAGFSERSSYRVEKRQCQPAKTERNWKTRKDPFEAVWDSEVVPLLKAEPNLQARTLLEELQQRYEGQYPDSLLRTLQRRVRQWRATSGPDKEVIFRQNHPPGWQGISDFTDATKLKVTIQGEAFPHLLYHYRLAYSGWAYAQVILGSESYTALAEGLQNAFWSSGRVPETHRTDSLSAAYKNQSDKQKEEFTQSYQAFCDHYGVDPTRNNKGISHENGSIESPHGHLKSKINQALMLRGSRDFDSVQDYRSFVQEVMDQKNKRIKKAFAEEREFLKPLPQRRTEDYTLERALVTTSSTISVKSVIYSVPSKLIGMTLQIHLYDDRLECFVGGDRVISIIRRRKSKKHLRFIDYRHVVGSLVRKPQAFYNYIYRDCLFPTLAFHQSWEVMERELGKQQACREFVKILYEAAQPEGEARVNAYLEEKLSLGEIPRSDEVKALFKRKAVSLPMLQDNTPNLSCYDALLRSAQGGAK